MRRELHKIPEIGLNLPKTASYVIDQLNKYGIVHEKFSNNSNIIATIHGKGSKIIALRADMDALPIQEKTHASYSSLHKGCMHACGHDAHTAMLLATAIVLKRHENELNGTVKLIFQSAEENFKGAIAIINSGKMKGIEEIYGIHIGSILGTEYESGKFIIPLGVCMASFAHFKVVVNGKGCHGSTPEKGIDPINIAAHIVLGLQTISTREINANKTLVITVGKINGGDEHNIIPDTVTIEGTIRTLDSKIREYAVKRIQEISEATAKMLGGNARFEIEIGADPLSNSLKTTLTARNAAKKVLNDNQIITEIDAPNLGGEDFAFYLNDIPGTFMFLSSSNSSKKTDFPHHSSQFNIDEDVLWKGAAVLVSIVEESLGQ